MQAFMNFIFMRDLPDETLKRHGINPAKLSYTINGSRWKLDFFAKLYYS